MNKSIERSVIPPPTPVVNELSAVSRWVGRTAAGFGGSLTMQLRSACAVPRRSAVSVTSAGTAQVRIPLDDPGGGPALAGGTGGGHPRITWRGWHGGCRPPGRVPAPAGGSGSSTIVPRTNLKGIGAVENSARGVWAITEKGAGLTQDQLRVDVKAWLADVRSKRLGRKTANADDGADAEDREDGHTPELTWKEQLLDRLLQLPPSGFERLAQRILREAGFVNVTVTGKSGDGGIDGVGTYRLSLVSFPIYFQCKRYRGAVPSRDVRDFRGALVGRGEKGLFITTGSFTRDAQREATREGASPIELIDGNQLCDLLKQYRLGVAVESRTVEDVALRPQFFDEYE